MKRFQLSFALAFALLLCSSAFAQSYSFQPVVNPNDPTVGFTQLLGINNSDVIAGYHNFNSNQGFTLVLPNVFTTENYPNSAMTQVIGINNSLTTDGFYVDQCRNHPRLLPHQQRPVHHRRLSRHTLQPAAGTERPPSGSGLLQPEHRQHHA